ncbi:hypothetical protein O181_118647, partial [Austropuccinia psidii MF-1]|nr:hypothetical protein [Austropuccinia psidii MF-1]
MSCTLHTKQGVPCICSSTTTNACDACRQEHKKCSFVFRPFRPRGQRSSHPRRPHKDSFVPCHLKHRFVHPPPRPPSNVHFTPRPEQSDYPANEGWRWKEDIRAWADCHHVLSPMGFKRQKQNPPDPPRQNSPVPSLPCEQTPRQPTPGPSGTGWLEELFR